MLPLVYKNDLKDLSHCSLCGNLPSAEESMKCQTCLRSFHRKCADLKFELRSQENSWICENCKHTNAMFQKLSKLEKDNKKMLSDREALRTANEELEKAKDAMNKLAVQESMKETLLAENAELKRQVSLSKDEAAESIVLNEKVKELLNKVQVLEAEKNVSGLHAELQRGAAAQSVVASDSGTRNVEFMTMAFVNALKETSTSHAEVTKTLLTEQKTLLNTVMSTKAHSKESLRKLPDFDGTSRFWPAYKRRFLDTSKIGNFTEGEDLDRIRDSLKGRARKLVESYLYDQTKIRVILDTLQDACGHSDVIYEELKAKVLACKPAKSNNAELIELGIAIRNLIETMRTNNAEAYFSDGILMEEILKRLPAYLKDNWYKYLDEDAEQGGESDAELNDNLRDYQREKPCMNFTRVYNVEDIYKFIEPVLRRANRSIRGDLRHFEKTGSQKAMHLHVSDKRVSPEKEFGEKYKYCAFCNMKNHYLRDCEKFKKKKWIERLNFVRSSKLCFGCLNSSTHRWNDCAFARECGRDGCKMKHHPLLHKEANSFTQKETTMLHKDKRSHIIYQIIPVIIRCNGKWRQILALLDTASSTTIIDRQLCDDLGIRGKASKLKVNWSQNYFHVEEDSLSVSVVLENIQNGSRHILNDVRTMKNPNLPVQSLKISELEINQHLKGLPIMEYKEGKPLMLIGMDHPHLLIARDAREIDDPNAPMAIETRLGWTVFGKATAEPSQYMMRIHENYDDFNDNALHQMVKDSFALENIVVENRTNIQLTRDEKQAQEILENSIEYDGERYVVGLPFREKYVTFPKSYEMAKSRLESTERKLAKDEWLKGWYNEKMLDYINRGFMRELTEEQQKDSWTTFFLPHFVIVNPNKTPLKPRIVYDAAAVAGSTKQSLNSFLLKGTDNIASLLKILVEFRSGPVAVVADVKEMFNCIRVRTEDTMAQCILWRFCKPKEEPKVYAFTRLLFGLVCSPYISQFVKDYNAHKFENEMPAGANVILNNTYIDDMIKSFENESTAIKTCKEVIKIWDHGGFEIRNFLSNSKELMNSLPRDRVDHANEMEIGSDQMSKVLGIFWMIEKDMFIYKINKNKIKEDILLGTKIPSKREILSIVMLVFDPLGFISHITIRAKILLQLIWHQGCTWDESIPENLYSKWSKWFKELQAIEQVEIPRMLTTLNGIHVKHQAHVFVDASDRAYACVIYIRTSDINDVQLSLLGSKAKVLPLNPPSVPRAELQAALLGVRLWKSLSKGINLEIEDVTYWTDSSTVLGWINSEKCYKPFVANRLGEIREETTLRQWRWVPTAMNVADEATKEITKSNWFTGPEFLKQDASLWPKKTFKIEDPDLEARTIMLHCKTDINKFDTIDATRYSSFTKLVKDVAILMKFVKWISNKKKIEVKQLTFEDINAAEKWLIEKSQFESFLDEMSLLKKGEEVKVGRLKDLNPVLAKDELMRLEGRLAYCRILTLENRNPIIMDHLHPITKLIVKQYHEKYKHQCQETIIAALRKKYWITNIRRAVKTAKANCQLCKNRSVKPIMPMMGQLPPCRTETFVKPFTFTGVDFFGPVLITVHRKREKRWVALFTCMTIRACHLELCRDLSTDSFILCLRNFMNRRGKIQEIYSDNGTNFLGTCNELEREARKLNIKWKFIPPGAPHMGGCWERLVQSVKKALGGILYEQSLREDTLVSALIEAENMVNSRPLTHIPIEHQDNEPLTPNHFLLGPLGGDIAAEPFDEEVTVTRKQWKISQQIAQHFWKRWINEYLPTLCKRRKWQARSEPVKTNDIVIITDEQQPRNTWLKGRVTEVTTAKDGQVRSCVVKTSNGVYKRPVAKLAVLDVYKREAELKDEGYSAEKEEAKSIINGNAGPRRSQRIKEFNKLN